jgi:hypothetical protein
VTREASSLRSAASKRASWQSQNKKINKTRCSLKNEDFILFGRCIWHIEKDKFDNNVYEARSTLLDGRSESLSIRCMRHVFDWLIEFCTGFYSITSQNAKRGYRK